MTDIRDPLRYFDQKGSFWREDAKTGFLSLRSVHSAEREVNHLTPMLLLLQMLTCIEGSFSNIGRPL